MTWFHQLSLTRRREAKTDAAVCSTYKPLPATPDDKDTKVDIVCTIVCCRDVKVDNSTNLFKPRQVVVKRQVLVSVPGKCNYFSAMALVEVEAVKVFGELAGNGDGNGGSRNSGAGTAKVHISKMLRSEALVKGGQKEVKEGVGMDKDNWEGALRMLSKPKAAWELLVAFHERPVVDKKQGLRFSICCSQ
ncbi:hypothetical protein LTR85_006602 [Meristemomyces frigidus]|nr:hypothetical protein LTR85_006602 [Meristemomyces frigidus]